MYIHRQRASFKNKEKNLHNIQINDVTRLLNSNISSGAPTYIEMLSKSMNTGHCTILVSNRVLYIDYIGLAIVPSWGE